VNFVEIDLLRGGPRMPLGQTPPSCDYYALVSRPHDRPKNKIWPVKLRERLPGIPIPVTNGRVGTMLDLQIVLDSVYDKSTFDLEIYQRTPDPPLSPEDAAWAQQFVPKPIEASRTP
jgi:hypothetical protein